MIVIVMFGMFSDVRQVSVLYQIYTQSSASVLKHAEGGLVTQKFITDFYRSCVYMFGMFSQPRECYRHNKH